MSYFSQYLRYTVPAIFSMVVSSLYVMVDGAFIGHAVGEVGLAAVNIVWPYLSLLQAIAMLIAVGCGTLVSVALAKGGYRESNAVFGSGLYLLILCVAVYTLAGYLLAEPICRFCGATELLLAASLDYLRAFLSCGFFWCLALYLAVLVRCDGAPGLFFLSMLAGTVCNVVLDALFIFGFGWGLTGSGLATGLGQLGAIVVLIPHFYRKKGALRLHPVTLRGHAYGHYLRVGMPEFIIQITFPFCLLCYNLVLIRLMGETGVAAYSVIGYVTSIFTAILIGMADGLQPLISGCWGRGDQIGIRACLRLGLAANTGLALLIYGLLWLLATPLCQLIAGDPQLTAMAAPALRINSLSVIFAAPTYVLTTYFLARKKSAAADLISVCRGLGGALCIFLIPRLLGAGAIWSAEVWSSALALLAAALAALLSAPRTTIPPNKKTAHRTVF